MGAKHFPRRRSLAIIASLSLGAFFSISNLSAAPPSGGGASHGSSGGSSSGASSGGGSSGTSSAGSQSTARPPAGGSNSGSKSASNQTSSNAPRNSGTVNGSKYQWQYHEATGPNDTPGWRQVGPSIGDGIEVTKNGTNPGAGQRGGITPSPVDQSFQRSMQSIQSWDRIYAGQRQAEAVQQQQFDARQAASKLQSAKQQAAHGRHRASSRGTV